jgi:hypothetical protein
MPVFKYNNAQHNEYLTMTDRIGAHWLDIFEGNKEFYSAAYWDLLTRIWRNDGPARKTDALKFMTAIKSPHTAGKYVESAIRHGLLVEKDNPRDKRSKLVMLSPDTKARLDAFFDAAVKELRRSSRAVDRKGPSPDEP